MNSLLRLLLCFFILVTPLFAQTTAVPATQDPQAMQLLAQCGAAMGVPSSTVQILAHGNVSYLFNGTTGSIVMKEKGLNRARNEITLNGNQQVFVVNSGMGFSVLGAQRANMAAHSTQYYRPELLSAAHCVLDAARPNISISYIGQEQLGNRTVHHLRFRATPQGKNPETDSLEMLISDFHIYLDTQSLVVLKTKGLVFSPNAIENRSDLETYYSDYRQVNGLLLPFHIQEFVGGQRFNDIVLTSVRTDLPVADSDFQ